MAVRRGADRAKTSACSAAARAAASATALGSGRLHQISGGGARACSTAWDNYNLAIVTSSATSHNLLKLLMPVPVRRSLAWCSACPAVCHALQSLRGKDAIFGLGQVTRSAKAGDMLECLCDDSFLSCSQLVGTCENKVELHPGDDEHEGLQLVIQLLCAHLARLDCIGYSVRKVQVAPPLQSQTLSH